MNTAVKDRYGKVIAGSTILIMSLYFLAVNSNAKVIDGVKQIIQWISKSIIDGLMNRFINATSSARLTDVMDIFWNAFPIMTQVASLIKYLGISIMFIVMLISLFRQFFEPLGFKSENPFTLVLNTALFAPVVYYGYDIANWIYSITQKPLEWVDKMLDVKGLQQLGNAVEKIDDTDDLSIITLLIWLVLCFMLFKAYIDFIGEFYELYVTMGFMMIFAPLCLAFFPSSTTRDFGIKWFKTFIAQIFQLFLMTIVRNTFIIAYQMQTVTLTIPE